MCNRNTNTAAPVVRVLRGSSTLFVYWILFKRHAFFLLDRPTVKSVLVLIHVHKVYCIV